MIGEKMAEDITKNVFQETMDYWLKTSYDFDLTPKVPHVLNNRKSQLTFDFLREIEKCDREPAALVGKRINNVVSLTKGVFDSVENLENQVLIPKENDPITEFVYDNVINHSQFNQFCRNTLKALAFGVSITQVVLDESTWLLSENQNSLRDELPGNFCFGDGSCGTENDNELYYWQNGKYHLAAPEKWICSTFQQEYENRWGTGLYQQCSLLSLITTQIRAWQMTFGEKNALGDVQVRVTEKGDVILPGGETLSMAQMLEMGKSYRKGAVAAIPFGLIMEKILPDVSKGADFFESVLSAAYQRKQLIIEGQTESSGMNQTKGSYSSSVEAGETLFQNQLNDLRLLIPATNRLIKTMLKYNFSEELADDWLKEFTFSCMLPERKRKENAEISKIKADEIEMMKKAGYEPTEIPSGYQKIEGEND